MSGYRLPNYVLICMCFMVVLTVAALTGAQSFWVFFPLGLVTLIVLFGTSLSMLKHMQERK